jgi:hypothetical protein
MYGLAHGSTCVASCVVAEARVHNLGLPRGSGGDLPRDVL